MGSHRTSHDPLHPFTHFLTSRHENAGNSGGGSLFCLPMHATWAPRAQEKEEEGPKENKDNSRNRRNRGRGLHVPRNFPSPPLPMEVISVGPRKKWSLSMPFHARRTSHVREIVRTWMRHRPHRCVSHISGRRATRRLKDLMLALV